jgi:hypothetical protein
MVRFTKSDCPVCLLLGPVTASALISVSSPWALFCFAATTSGPFSCYASLCRHWPKSCSSALSDLDCPSISEHPLIHALIACVAPVELFLSLREPNGPVWYSGLSGFPVLEPSCPAGGRHSHNGHLLCSSLHGQNLQ